jgi:dihydrofolate synthase/folylpolyglutamate synthase
MSAASGPDEEFQEAADQVYADLLARIGESTPQPRLSATRRAVELLGDPHRSYPSVHVTGTNGKTSTSRIIESLLRAHGLRTGLLTSPHLARVNERIVIDGEPIANEQLVQNWADVQPYLLIVDAELTAAGEQPLSYFEALTVLALASFADAPIDVAVIEVGMGGEWDSTNVVDGQVAVFTPVALDHVDRLGSTVEEIARTKSGIIKPSARIVSARQSEDVAAVLREAAELSESELAVEGRNFGVVESAVAVGGQLLSVRGIAGRYDDQFLPLFGDHQAQNTAVAIAAVESFLGDGRHAIPGDVLAEGLATVTSPGRLQLIGIEPSVIVDAAHNPHGAEALTSAITEYFDFDEVAVVLGVLTDKDAAGIIAALAPLATRFAVTQSSSERAIGFDELADEVESLAPEADLGRFESVDEALTDARAWASQGPRRAVLVTGSVTLVADAMAIAERERWKP